MYKTNCAHDSTCFKKKGCIRTRKQKCLHEDSTDLLRTGPAHTQWSHNENNQGDYTNRHSCSGIWNTYLSRHTTIITTCNQFREWMDFHRIPSKHHQWLINSNASVNLIILQRLQESILKALLNGIRNYYNRLSNQPKWKASLMKGIDLKTSIPAIIDAIIQSEFIYVVFGGSAKEEKMTYGWVMCTP